MIKEAKSIIRYIKLLRLEAGISIWVKEMFIVYGILSLIRFIFTPEYIKGYIMAYCIFMIFPVLIGLVISTIVKICEVTNKHIYGTSKQLKISSIDEIIELLRNDKKIHFEIMKIIASNRSLINHEIRRYDGVRRLHYLAWFMQSEEENDEFRRKESTEVEVEQYLKKQAEMKDELLYVFDDDEDVQEMILEQYNRIRTKTLVWPKVISKK